MDLLKGFNQICPAQLERFRPYTYDRPLLISAARCAELKQVGLALHKALVHLAANYRQYLPLMPFAPEDLRILEACDRFPYHVGTFRTDFVVDVENNIRLIEMTTRQPLNGYFISGFMWRLAQEQAARFGLEGALEPYPALFSYLEHYMGAARHVCVVKGNERMGEFKLYPELFERAGLPCQVIAVEQLPASLDQLEDAFVIEELNHAEIRRLPLEAIDALTRARLHNDLRTIFFAHDKRFFHLLGQDLFLNAALAADERALLRRYLTPTYVYGAQEAVWADAYLHPERYILKHAILGKSEQVYAGCVTRDSIWKGLFDTGLIRQMVLQPFIEQRKFQGTVGEERRDDYVAGTLLYFNQEFFGPGIFRASSFPVTNQADDRKIAPLVVADEDAQAGCNCL